MMTLKEWYIKKYQNKEIEKIVSEFIDGIYDHNDMITQIKALGYDINEHYELKAEISLRLASYSNLEYVLYNEKDQEYFTLFDGLFISKKEWDLEFNTALTLNDGYPVVPQHILLEYEAEVELEFD